jgi:hypothetical protein
MSGWVTGHYRRNVSAETLAARGISVEMTAEIDSVAERDIPRCTLVHEKHVVSPINLTRGADAFINVWQKSLVRRCDARCFVRGQLARLGSTPAPGRRPAHGWPCMPAG